jgi:hypothetical protein
MFLKMLQTIKAGHLLIKQTTKTSLLRKLLTIFPEKTLSFDLN